MATWIVKMAGWGDERECTLTATVEAGSEDDAKCLAEAEHNPDATGPWVLDVEPAAEPAP